MYVAVKGGEKAIRAAHALQEQKRRGDGRLPELSVDQIGEQLNLAVIILVMIGCIFSC